ncbi:hypothetical protein F5878DRAFT_533014, partial [Lentinula raphanica]
MLAKFEELERKVDGKKKKKCSNCGREGHLQQDCYRKGGGKEGQYPSWWRNRSGGGGSTDAAESQAANMSSVAELPQHYALMANVNSGGEGSLFADSGATDHFFRNKSDFVTYSP